MTKKSGSGKTIGAFIAGALLLTIILTGYYTNWTWNFAITPTREEPTGDWVGGIFTLTVSGRNTLDSTASLTVGTDFSGSWYGKRSGAWVFLGAASGSGGNIESTAEDKGYIYLKVEEVSTKYYYVDPATTIAQTYTMDYQWIDIDADTEKEFVYRQSLWAIPKPASGYPARTFYVYFKADSGQGTAANALQWQTQPADITGIGTSTVTKYIGWETKLSAAQRAVGVYKVTITINSTSTTKWEITSLNIPGVGLISGSLLDEDVQASQTVYTYEVPVADFNNVLYWQVLSGQNNKFDNTLAIKCKFGSGEKYGVTLTIYQLLYDRTTVSDYDLVGLAA